MYSLKLFIFLLFLMSCLSSCNDKDPLSPELTVAEDSLDITVFTQNIYVGTDVDIILQAEDPNQIPILVAQAFGTLVNTNFPERAEALAKEIFEKKPHLIGLQEVSLIRIQSPGDAVVGGTTPAEEIVWDYLEILMATLSNLGLDYEVVAQNQNFDLEMPMITKFEEPYEFDDIRLTDYDVILAKKGVLISDVESINYEAKVILADLGIEFSRGLNAVTAEVNGQAYRFVNTHLEDETILEVQKAQAEELMLYLNNVDLPVILVGDFNSAATDEATYQIITSDHNYQDAWLLNETNNDPNGFTYGNDSDLKNAEQNFWKRIDYIFVQDGKGGESTAKSGSRSFG